jgi:hypothetical protein
MKASLDQQLSMWRTIRDSSKTLLEDIAYILGDSTLDAWDETYIKQISNIADDADVSVEYVLREMKKRGEC